MPHMSGASPTRHFQERPRLAGEPEPRELRLLAKQPLGDILPGEDRAAGGAQQIPEAMRPPHAGGSRRRLPGLPRAHESFSGSGRDSCGPPDSPTLAQPPMPDAAGAALPAVILIATKQEWATRSLESILAPRGYVVLRSYTARRTLER